MAVLTRTLTDTQRAFDSVARDYDRSNCENRTLCWMRERAIAALLAHVPASGRVLDLGCGPGTDVETLVRNGLRVTAIDWSPAMVEETRQRLTRLGTPAVVEVHHLGIQQLDRLSSSSFDAAFSNFGPLNCVPDLARAAALIADRLCGGGVLVASVIGKVCPWEIAAFAARRDWQRIGVRFAPREVAVPLNGETVWTTYYSPQQFARPFEAAGFRRISLRALELLAPPPYMDGFSRRHQGFVAALRWLEDRVAAWPVVRNCGDHFLIVMRKRRK